MIWYAFEILQLFVLLVIAFFVYRWLVNSPRFTRFIERTKGTPDMDIADMEARLEADKKAAKQVVEAVEAETERRTKAGIRLRTSIGNDG